MDTLNIKVEMLSWNGTNTAEIEEFVGEEYEVEQIDWKTLLFDRAYEVPIGWYFVKTSSIFEMNDFYEDEIVVISPETYREWREENLVDPD